MVHCCHKKRNVSTKEEAALGAGDGRGNHAGGLSSSRRAGEPRARTRRRGEALEAAILRAAWDELAAVGYARMTMERVAARAETSKAVVYRRWPNRAELVLAAMRQRGPVLSGEVPDTGELRGDVLALLRRVSRRLEEIGSETLHGLMIEYFDQVERSAYLHGRRVSYEAMMTILERAAERGEVRLEKITPRIASLPTDLVRHELLLTRAPVPEAAIVEIVDEIFLPLVRARSDSA
jgi:AcrR family transcriptional regulator